MIPKCPEVCPKLQTLQNLEGSDAAQHTLGRLRIQREQEAVIQGSENCPGPSVVKFAVEVPTSTSWLNRLFRIETEIITKQELACGQRVVAEDPIEASKTRATVA